MREEAERDCSAPPGLLRGSGFAGAEATRAEALARLDGLLPCAASLLALVRLPADRLWEQLAGDPAAVLLLARRAAALAPDAPPAAISFSAPTLLTDPALLEDAVRLLDSATSAFVDWSHAGVRPIYHAALTLAHKARRLAQQSGVCDPETAWVCGLLAPLGWIVLAALSPAQASACLADPELPQMPAQVQRRCWGLDQGAIARRVARRWQLPAWLAASVADLSLPTAVACARGADPILLRLTRLAIATTPATGLSLAREATAYLDEDRRALGLGPESWPTPGGDGVRDSSTPLDGSQDPRRVPLLRDLLASTAQSRQLQQRMLYLHLEDEVDHLHRSLASQAREEDRRVRDGRLEALAEFAAGAGHEINNPLAVISGQAQYLLGHVDEWFDAEAAATATGSLQTIIAQARRIHGLLRDLMVFARPTPPNRAWFDLPALLGEVAASMEELAAQRQVRIEITVGPDRLAVRADVAQVRQALGCLLRNAIEAAGPGGWTRLVLRDEAGRDNTVEVAVEDGGPGPDPARQEALFDPFFSGRSAGRGRGLGLPVAWRLARQQEGDVRLEPRRPGEPTRFILSLPRPATPPPADVPLMSAPATPPVSSHGCSPSSPSGSERGATITPLAG